MNYRLRITRTVLAVFLASTVVAAGALASMPRSDDVPGSGDGSAVVLVDETTFTVNGDQAHMSRRLAVRINSREGRHYGRLRVGHDAFRSIRALDGRILDTDGAAVRRLRRSDVRDRPGTDGISLYDEFRVRDAQLYHDEYPHVVEWTWEVIYQSLLIWPAWYPQRGLAAVEEARLVVDVPADYPLRYATSDLDIEPIVTTHRRRTHYEWQTSLPARASEPLVPRAAERPAVRFAPESFRMDRTRGSLVSWEEFGNWYRDLSRGRDQLPEDALAEVQALVAGVEDPMDRARIVYRYLQRRTRYVSVQLGIGGWQPFDAVYVHERRYGDCKALTNYLQSLLRAVGVESFPALIGADAPDLDPDFPSNQFNHVVLFVPMGEREPLWLEATSSNLPFGQLGPGTEGRHALVVTPQGGQLHRTPTWSAEQNTEVRHVNARLRADGVLEADVAIEFGGHNVGLMRGSLSRLGAGDRSEWLEELLALSRTTFDDIDVTGLDSGDPTLAISTSLTAEGYATAAGRRLFFNPNLTRRQMSVPPQVASRNQPVEAFRYAFVDRDTVRVRLPDELELEVRPEAVEIDVDFARYAAHVEEAGRDLVYVRHFEIREPRLPAERYDDLRDFLSAAARADETVLVLSRRD